MKQQEKQTLKDQATAWHLPIIRTKLPTAKRVTVRTVLSAIYSEDSIQKPIAGTVIAANDQFVMVQNADSRTAFNTVLASLLDKVPVVGDKVEIEGYKQLDFQGLASDGSMDPVDASTGIKTTVIRFRRAQSRLPIKWEGRDLQVLRTDDVLKTWQATDSEYLKNMCEMLESMATEDGMVLTDILLRNGAGNPTVIDETDITADRNTWPGIAFPITNAKFTGKLTIRLDLGSDTCSIDLEPETCASIQIDNVYFDDVERIVLDAIDCDSWNKLRVKTVKASKAAKPQKVAA